MTSATDRLRPMLPKALTPATRTMYRRLTRRHSRELVQSRMIRDAMRTLPRTYNEKMRYKMAFDRRPVLTTLADKVAVREYVADRVGTEILSVVYTVATDPADIDWASVPHEYVVKVNHASGGMVIVWDGANANLRLPVRDHDVGWDRLQLRPEHFDQERMVALLRHWLDQDFSWFPGKGMIEWAYADVPRQVLVEELLQDQGELPRDLKFTLVDGEVVFIQVDSQRFGSHSKDLMTSGWDRIPVEYNRIPMSRTPPPRPRHLNRMLQAALELGRGLDFIRADFYELGDRIVFGELTNYPACGNGNVNPPRFDLEWGTKWRCHY